MMLGVGFVNPRRAPYVAGARHLVCVKSEVEADTFDDAASHLVLGLNLA